MKSISTLLTAALLLSLGNGLTVPVENTVEVRELEESIDVRDLEFLLDDRAVKPKYSYTNFPSSATCATEAYNKGNVHDSGDQAGRLQSRGKQVGANKYPHVFQNRNNEITNFDKKCKSTLYEFPILPSKKVYTGATPDDPGPDRIVVNVSAMDKKTGKVQITFCGLMTHTGARNRASFVNCSWK
ncbi:Ribonuclease/ribotoxin [Annulohypoxylon bovei var. microspora]|nr:Ribonuclease/ribotoxin [Annulohypoxylon bovei var. microspora]